MPLTTTHTSGRTPRAWISRGHERQDDTDCPHCGEPECQCPHEPFYCDHRIEVGTFCAACAVAGEAQLAAMFVKMLKKIEGGGHE